MKIQIGESFMQAYMKTTIITAMFLCLVILGGCVVGGCDQKDFDQIDQTAQTVDQIADGGKAVLNSPVGVLIPEPYKAAARLGLEAISAIAALWFANKARIRGVVLRSVVQAVDDPGSTKDAVKANLRAANVEAVGREIIREYRKAG